ncbi:MAG: heterodisulfide reductase-related iron-sulfur binding cluster [Candidatus Eremiobacteraeota bacterium]|nr:heterodisulfide reductase-related iron-sulfur binding cluster [Candidatus Eremiobacteraeota bacterium]
MKYGLFMGCTIPVRATHYELSARRILERLGIEVSDIEGFSCCGFPLKSVDTHTAELIAARNLACASKEEMGICTLCSACTSMLTETALRLEEPDTKEKVNGALSEFGLQYEKPVKIRHFARLIVEEAGSEKIGSLVTRPLKGLRLAVHYGCHFTKPSEIYEGFDSAEIPRTIDGILALTGAETIAYSRKTSCCGGSLLGINEQIALSMAHGKLHDLKESGVDALVLVCPFCSVMYDDSQKKIETQFSEAYNLPVLYLSQVLGLAMGVEDKDLGFRLNKVSVQPLLEKISLRDAERR